MSPSGARRAAILAATIACGAAWACGGPAPAPRATLSSTSAVDIPKPAGRIRGTVTLRGPGPTARSEAVDKDRQVCGTTVPVTRLTLGPNQSVRDTFIYLDNVHGADPPRPRLLTEIAQNGCAYGPHVTTLAAGADLQIVNDDPILHNVHAKASAPDGLQTIFNIAQPVRGQRTTIEGALTKPGIVALTCEAGHPWMTAYILVANHPYVATTNSSGEFVIDGVPPGTYPIKMWHEGVQLKRIVAALQRFEYEDPYEAAQDVTVSAGADTVVDFSFELRPAP